HVQIQVLVIEFFQHAEENTLQIKQIDHHPSLRIDLAGHGHVEQIVMAVGRRVVAAPEHRSVFGFVPFRPVIPVGGSKLNPFGKEHGSHFYLQKISPRPSSRRAILPEGYRSRAPPRGSRYGPPLTRLADGDPQTPVSWPRLV